MYSFIVTDYAGNVLWSKYVQFPTADDYTESEKKVLDFKRELETDEVFLQHGEV